MKRILICGDRNWGRHPHDALDFQVAMEQWIAKHGLPEVVIEGCARGADSMAEEWANQRLIRVRHHPAEWDKHGKAAGPIRNNVMLMDGPEAVIAFHRDLANSKGTKHMVSIARKNGTPVWVPIKQPLDPNSFGF